MIHIIRHGEALHNIDHEYLLRDPPLTSAGIVASGNINVPSLPDLIIVSPMTRTIQTAMSAFPTCHNIIRIWPDLREAHDATCNLGRSRRELENMFPLLDFMECPEEWDHTPHTAECATLRGEAVRNRSKHLSETYKNIVLVTHRVFIAFLVKGDRFNVCEMRSYRFLLEGEPEYEKARRGFNIDTHESQDYGPTVLVPCGARG